MAAADHQHKTPIVNGNKKTWHWWVGIVLIVVAFTLIQIGNIGDATYSLSSSRQYIEANAPGISSWFQQQQSSWSVPQSNDSSYIAFCAIARDEKGILEWVVYHNAIGVNKFYLMDNDSNPPLKPILQPFIDSGLVNYTYSTSTDERRQRNHYEDCYRHRQQHQFIAFVDADEFVILNGVNAKDLPAVLSPFEDYACIGVPWRIFCSSGHLTPPKDGVLLSYTACEPIDPSEKQLGKVFSNPRFIRGQGIHRCVESEGKNVTSINGGPLSRNGFSYMSDGPIMLHHYRTKSLQEYEHKMAHGSMPFKFNRSMDGFHRTEEMCTETCTYAMGLGRMTQRLIEGFQGDWTRNP